VAAEAAARAHVLIVYLHGLLWLCGAAAAATCCGLLPCALPPRAPHDTCCCCCCDAVAAAMDLLGASNYVIII
jgi:hypothetical protein